MVGKDLAKYLTLPRRAGPTFPPTFPHTKDKHPLPGDDTTAHMAQKYLVILAGGQGLRMGSSTPKQLLDLDGKPVLRRTMERFIGACPDIRIVTVLGKSSMDGWKEYCLSDNFSIPQKMVSGGITRFHSVRNALSKIPDGAIVAIHDGVRPLLTEGLIRRMFSRMERGDIQALIPVIPSVDTLKYLSLGKDSSGEEEFSVPDNPPDLRRELVWGAQTPQMFLSGPIRRAYDCPFDTSFTDDASVAGKMGMPLTYCMGERLNIKITTPEDLLLAEAILSMRKGKAD